MNTFPPSIPLPANLGVLPAASGETSLPNAAGSSSGAFQKLMKGCMAKACNVDSKSAESEQPAGTTAVDSESDAASLEGMILAGLQAAEAAVMQGVLEDAQDVFVPEEAEGMVSAETALQPAFLDFAAVVSPGAQNAGDVPAEGLEVRATDPSDALSGKITGVSSDAAAEENTVSPDKQNTENVPVKGSVVKTKDLSDAVFGKTAGTGSDAVAEENTVSPDKQNTGDVPVKGPVVQAKDLSDAVFEKTAGAGSDAVAKEDAAPLLRQFSAASDRSESGSSHVVASDERNALKESDKGFTPVREPAPSVAPTPAEAGFAGAAQETARPAHPVSADPALIPQRLFEVGEHSFVLTRKSDTSVEVTLSPPGVGKLDIEVVLDKGVINANIIAADSKGLEAIERSLPRILEVLANEGIAVGGFNVSLKGGGYGGREARQAEEMPENDSAISVTPEVVRTKAATSGLVDILV